MEKIKIELKREDAEVLLSLVNVELETLRADYKEEKRTRKALEAVAREIYAALERT